MASVTFSGDPAVSARSEAAAVPRWWRQPHSFALAAMAVGHVALVVGIARSRMNADLAEFLPGADEAFAGLLFAECYLLGLWAALGGLRAIPRWLIVAALYSGGLVAFVRLGKEPAEFEDMLAIGLIGGLLITAFAVALVPLRGLAGWRIDFDPAYHQRVTRRRGQIGLMDFAVYSCCVAIPLMAMRLLVEGTEGPTMEEMPIIFAALGIIAATASPITYALLVWRRASLAFPFAFVCTLAVAWLHSGIAAVVEDLDFMGPGTRWLGLSLPLFAFHAGIAATVFGTLLILRCFGLRLIVVGKF